MNIYNGYNTWITWKLWKQLIFYKTHINAKSLDYIEQQVGIYANLFEIKLTKPLKIYEYAYEVNPEIAD